MATAKQSMQEREWELGHKKKKKQSSFCYGLGLQWWLIFQPKYSKTETKSWDNESQWCVKFVAKKKI